jgi:hypothetical protein
VSAIQPRIAGSTEGYSLRMTNCPWPHAGIGAERIANFFAPGIPRGREQSQTWRFTKDRAAVSNVVSSTSVVLLRFGLFTPFRNGRSEITRLGANVKARIAAEAATLCGFPDQILIRAHA